MLEQKATRVFSNSEKSLLTPVEQLQEIAIQNNLSPSFMDLLNPSYERIVEALMQTKTLSLSDTVKTLEIFFHSNTSDSAINTFSTAMDCFGSAITRYHALTDTPLDMQAISHLFDVIKTDVVPRTRLKINFNSYRIGLLRVWYNHELKPLITAAVKEMVTTDSYIEYIGGISFLINRYVDLPTVLSVFHHFVNQRQDRTGTFLLDDFLKCIRMKFDQNQILSPYDIQAVAAFNKDLKTLFPRAEIHGHDKIIRKAMLEVADITSGKVSILLPKDSETRNMLGQIEVSKSDMYPDYSVNMLQDASIVSKFIKYLHSKSNSDDISMWVDTEYPGLFDNKLPEILRHPALIEHLSVLLDEPDQYRFQIGVLLALITKSQLPHHIQERIQSQTVNEDMKLRVGFLRWSLCDDAEYRFMESFMKKTFVVVNQHFIVKMIGRMSALCLNTCTTPDGNTFYAGNWYSLIDEGSRNHIRRIYDQGIHQTTLASSHWGLMRTFGRLGYKEPEDVIQEVKAIVKDLPEKLPLIIQGIPRQQYRLMKFESDY